MDRVSRRITRASAVVGGPLFLVGTVLHPARDGAGVAAAGQLYGITHAVQAIGLALQVVALAGLLSSGRTTPGSRGPLAWYTALVGTLAWFGLIVYDGSHNPITARYAPELVHRHADLDPGGAIIVLPALILFPLGYAVLGGALVRGGRGWPGWLLAVGAVTYTVGGLLIFAIGPGSPLVQILEVVGAAPYALGFALLARSRNLPVTPPPVAPPPAGPPAATVAA